MAAAGDQVAAVKVEEVIFSGPEIFGCDANMGLLANAHVILRLAYFFFLGSI